MILLQTNVYMKSKDEQRNLDISGFIEISTIEVGLTKIEETGVELTGVELTGVELSRS